MSLESMPVAPLPAASAPPVKTAPRPVADTGPRFADLMGGLVEAEAEAASPAEPAAGPAAPRALPAEDAAPAPDNSALDDAIVAATVVPWALLPPAVGAPASPPVALEGESSEGDLGDTAPAVVGDGAPVGVPVVSAPVPAVGDVSAVPLVQPASADPAGEVETAWAAERPPAGGEAETPHDDGGASLAPNPPAARAPAVPVEQGQQGTGQPPAETQKAAAPSEAVMVPARSAGADGLGAPAEAASEPVGPDGNAMDRFLRRERGEASATGGRLAAEARGGATPAPDPSFSKAVAPTAMTGAAAAQAAADLAGPPAATDARGPAVSEPRPSSDELEPALAAEWLNAQRETAGGVQSLAGGGESSGSERRPLAGESARAALEALAAQARAPRAAVASPGGTAVPAPVLDGLEARFQAWLTQASATSPVLAPETPDVPDVPGQVVKAIQMQWRDGIGEARVQLRPEHLGTVTVSLRVDHGTVVATVRAESPAALELIRARQQELQEALEAQGLQVNGLEITLDPEDRRERPAHREPDAPRPPRRRETNARFEVVA